MRHFKITSVMPVLFLLACSTTRITHSWKAENTVAKKYNKIMVVGLIKDSDIRIRERMENHLVDDLHDLGYNAVSSLSEYGPKAFDKLDEEGAINKLNNSGVDAVITIVMLDKTKERRYVPGTLAYTPYSMYYRRFWPYYNTMYIRIYSPGYYEVNTRYFWESNLYDVNTKELLYSVQTESFDPGTAETLGHEYGKMIVKDLVKKDVLLKQEAVTVK